MNKMKKVDYYYDTILPNPDPSIRVSLLEEYFEQATKYNEGNFFEDIYIPIRLVTSEGMAENYSYINVGLTCRDIADIYWSQYSGNYLINSKLSTRMQSIFKKNLGKYLRLVELEGYEYNPLWNVDGEEIRQNLENRGTNDTEYGGVDSQVGTAYNNSTTEHSSTTYDGTVKTETTDTFSGNGVVPTGGIIEYVKEITEGADKGKIEVASPTLSGNPQTVSYLTNGHKTKTTNIHNLAKNKIDGLEADYVVTAKDTAFGTQLIGGNRMFVEKYIRHGNIGVTKTSELIRDQREIVRFNILQEFFDDINQVILIGLYGNYDCI